MGTVAAIVFLLALLGGRREGRGGGGGAMPGVPPALQVPPLPPSSSVDVTTHDGGSILPGVPADLQRPVVTVTSSPSPAPSSTRQTRVSTQTSELPSSPEMRRLPINVRAEGRRLALVAASAVRAETAARGARRPLEAVRAFQGYVGRELAGPADGKWGRTTARAAGLFAGAGMVPGAVW